MDKLLILGATYHEIDIIRRAHAKGIYVIVTDNNLDWSRSPAKYVADEAWDISWSDIDTLHERCLEAEVKGVMAGFSEFRVENMIKLCGRLGLPCTLTMEQLDLTRDKIRFKELCKRYDVPVVPEYRYGDELNFPVIIKPVDRAGSIGINVAHNQEEFERYYRIAYDLSPSRSVIIEDFIENGVKTDFYYYVRNGKTSLLGTSDTIMCKGREGAPILQKAWTFPSVHESQYIESVDGKIREMCRGIGIKEGYMTMSAFYRNGGFQFFEAGFRLSGELSYNYYGYLSGINYMDTLIDYSLGRENQDIYRECFELNKGIRSVILNFFALDGTISEIITPDLGKELQGSIIPAFYVRTGDTVRNETNIFKKASMYTICSHSTDFINETVRKINSGLKILDSDGRDLIYEKVDEMGLRFIGD